MASRKIKGIMVEIGGDTTKLGEALESVDSKTRSLQGELRQVEKLLKMDPGNTELIAQKQEILKAAISETVEKLKTLETAQERAKALFDEGKIGADQYRAFQRELITTESKLESLRNKFKEFDSTLNSIDSDTGDTRSAFDKLSDTIDDQEKELKQLKDEYIDAILAYGKNSDEAKKLKGELSKLNGELKKNKSTMDDAESEADDLASALNDTKGAAQNAGDGFTILGGALSDITASVVKSAVSAIGDLIGSLFDLSEATEEYRSMQAKLTGASRNYGYSVGFAKRQYEEFYTYLGDDQMSTNAVTNLMGIGTSVTNLAALADGAIGVWASYGDSIPIESLTESINETIRVGKVTGTMADTINWSSEAADNLKTVLGGNSKALKAFNKALKDGETTEDAFNAALEKVTSAEERAAIVAEFLNTTYGESKSTYDELTSSMLEANAAELKLKDAQAELGEAVEPVNTAFTNFKAQALEALLPIVQSLADGFSNMLAWLKEHPAVFEAVKVVIIALAAAFGVLAAALGITAIINGVTAAMSALGISMAVVTAPITLIIAAIAAVVAAFIYLWNNCEGFRQFWIDLWNSIVSACSSAWDAIVNFFTVTIPNAFQSFTNLMSWVGATLASGFSNIGASIASWCSSAIATVVNWGANLWTTITTWVSTAVSSAGQFFSNLATVVGSACSNALTAVISWGSSVYTNITTWISTAVSSAGQFFSGLAGSIGRGLSSALTAVINWGSSLWTNITTWVSTAVSGAGTAISGMGTAIRNGLSSGLSAVASWGSSMLAKALTACTTVVSGIGDAFTGLPDTLTTIGTNLVQGLWNGISNMAEWIKEKISGFGEGVLSALKSFFGIASPSKLMRDEVGKYLAEGIGVGIEVNSDKPLNALTELGEEMANQELALNGATINRNLATTFSVDPAASKAASERVALLSKLDSIYDRLSRLQIVLDTGTLVGETIDQIDAGLADKQLLSARGV